MRRKKTIKKTITRAPRKKRGTDFDALLKIAWHIHRTSGHKFTMAKLEKAKELLWGKG